MTISVATDYLAARIALVHRYILDWTQRAAVANGAAAEESIALLLDKQQELLSELLKQQEAFEAVSKVGHDRG